MSRTKVNSRMFGSSAVFQSLPRLLRLVYHPSTAWVVFFISLCLIKSEPKVPFEVQTPKLFTCIVITSEDPRFLFRTAGVSVYHKTHLKSFIIVFLITLMQVHLLLITPRAAKPNKYSAWLGLISCRVGAQVFPLKNHKDWGACLLSWHTVLNGGDRVTQPVTRVTCCVRCAAERKKKKRPTDCAMCISDTTAFVGGGERGAVVNPSTERRRRASHCAWERVRLFVFIHVAYCRLLGWALVRGTLFHKSFNPTSPMCHYAHLGSREQLLWCTVAATAAGTSHRH